MFHLHALNLVLLAWTGTSPFVAILTKITDSIKPAVVPAAVLGLTFYFVFTFLAPWLPEGAMNVKGYFMKAVVALIGFSMIGTLVTWLSTLAA